MFCPQCGHQVPDGLSSCPKCDAKLAADQTRLATQAQTPAALPTAMMSGKPKGKTPIVPTIAAVAVDADIASATIFMNRPAAYTTPFAGEDQVMDNWPAGNVAISAGQYHAVGLSSNGIVVAAGLNEDGQCDVSGWNQTSR